MNAYDQLIRDLARRDLAREAITLPEMAVVIEQHPDVVAEAMEPALMAEVLAKDFCPAAVGQAVLSMLRVRCLGFVYREVKSMREELRQEELEDKEFARESA